MEYGITLHSIFYILYSKLMNTPLVAIVGLPNSGKSTFFNKVLRTYKALTFPEEGTTRDRHYGLTSWNGFDFYLIDTAGINNKPDSELEKNVQKQTAIAIEEADLILLMVDGKSQVSAKDLAVAAQLNRAKKPKVLAVNKIDVRNQKSEVIARNFQKLGLGRPFLISSANGSGMGDLLDAVVTKFPKVTFVDEGDLRLKIAFIGKPNVGKSSLVNALIKQERLLVDNKPGTTRSTVEIPFQFDDQKFLLLDTAGIKKKWKSDDDVSAAAAMQSINTLARVDVVLFVLDAAAEITIQDQAIATKILESNKKVLVLLNKIDMLAATEREKFLDKLPHYLPKLWFAPVVYVSAKTQEGLKKMLQLVQEVVEKALVQIPQEELDGFLGKLLNENFPGKMDDQRAPKIYGLTQIRTNPPIFELAVNFPNAFAPAWKNLLEKQFRLRFGFEGSPIIIRYHKRI